MTRMELKRRKRIVTAVLLAAAALGVIVGCCAVEFDRKALYTACAVSAAYAVAYGLLRVVLWLDGGKRNA